jgi:hypothetical protein
MRRSSRTPKLRTRGMMQLELLETRQLMATIVVNTTADSTTPGATLSLRQAIELSDGTLAVAALTAQEQAQLSGGISGLNAIAFNIPKTDPGYVAATGVWTIALHSALPAIQTNAAIIDGYSQPGAAQNTQTQGDSAKLAIAIDGKGSGAAVGITIDAAESWIRGLDIENFGGTGVVVAAANDVEVTGCFIGTDPTGKVAAPNGTGVEIENSSDVIGGPDPINRNVISGNTGYGIWIPDQAGNPLNIEPTGNQIENNEIGTDATGTKALGNGYAGIDDASSGNTYGGSQPGLGNVISGNKAGGIKTGGSVTIAGNYVGTDATGELPLGNQGGFPGIDASQDAGGAPVHSTIITSNVVANNKSGGIEVSGSSNESQATYTIENNLIGTDATGTVAMGNGSVGLLIASVANAVIQSNVISANNVGLQYSQAGTFAQNGYIQGNFIGTDKAGHLILGNLGPGIILDNAQTNLIGGVQSGRGNVIAHNGGDAILAMGGQDDTFSGNAISGNAGAGIKLESGANDFPVAPGLTFTPQSGGGGMLLATLTATPSTAYIVQIFSNPSAAVAGHEQGQTLEKSVQLITDSHGHATLSEFEPNSFSTATATDPAGNTSAFSAATAAQSTSASQTVVSSSSNPSTVGQQVTFTAVVTAPGFAGTPTGTVTFTIDGQAQTPVPLSVVGGMDEARFQTSALTAGKHSISAAYSGDTNVSGSGGSLPTQTVNASNLHSSLTALLAAPNPSMVGQKVTFTAIVTSPGVAGIPTGTVTFSIDGTPQTPVALNAVNGFEEATTSIATLTVGTHTIAVTYSGDATFAASAVASPVVQTVTGIHSGGQPPPPLSLVTMESVRLRTNKKHLVVGVIVGFSGELNSGQAENLSEYRLVKAGKRGVFTAKRAMLIKLRSAVYSGTSDTLILTPKKPFALTKPVQLQVSGEPPTGLEDILGRLIDGNDDGQPGGNASAVLRRTGAKIAVMVAVEPG